MNEKLQTQVNKDRMNIQPNFCFHYAAHVLKENLFRSLTEKEKKIALIVSAAFVCLAACYTIKQYCFKAARLDDQDKKMVDDSVDQEDFGTLTEESEEASEEKPNDFIDTKDSSPKPSTIDENELDTDDSIKNTSLPYEPPILQDLGIVRQGKDGGETPSFASKQIAAGVGPFVVDNRRLWTAAFACCFHTTESHQEIYKLMMNIREDHSELVIIEMMPCREMMEGFGGVQEDPIFVLGFQHDYKGTLTNWYNHLVKLHDALPGKPQAKEVKIYWSDRVKAVLFPYFLEDSTANIDQLLFALIPGEECASPFQAPDMDFSHQLEFVGLDKKKLMENMLNEIDRMGKILTRKDILPQIQIEIESCIPTSNMLMKDAWTYTLLNYCRLNLRSLEKKGKKINFENMSADEKINFIQTLLKPL